MSDEDPDRVVAPARGSGTGYCTIVQEKIIYRLILSDFSFDDSPGSPASR